MSESGEYDSDEILSQALDIYEKQEADKMFLTQNKYRNVPDDNKDSIFSILQEAVDVSDMLDASGASEIGIERRTLQQKRNLPEDTVNQEIKFKDVSSRFKPVTPQHLETMSKPLVPVNTLRKTMWAVNLYTDWFAEVLQFRGDPAIANILQELSDLLNLSDQQINTVLSSFVLSLRKKDGSEYTSGSFFSVVTALQKHLEINGRRLALLNDPELRTCLDNTMQKVTRQGVGIVKKQANVISKEHKNELWDNGFLGNQDAKTLLHTLFWTIGINFGLRGGDEHRNFTLENFKIFKDQQGMQYLEHSESISKTYQGGIKHRRIDPHKAPAYEIVGSSRCPAKIFQEYVAKLNPEATKSAFYFQPLVKSVGNVWFSITPVCHNKLKDFVNDIMFNAGFQGYSTNHSLRATTAIRLFQENIPEQLIMELINC